MFERLSISTRVLPDFKREVGKAADKDGVSLNEWFIRLAANKIGRPDLGVILRKKMGRPRKGSAV